VGGQLAALAAAVVLPSPLMNETRQEHNACATPAHATHEEDIECSAYQHSSSSLAVEAAQSSLCERKKSPSYDETACEHELGANGNMSRAQAALNEGNMRGAACAHSRGRRAHRSSQNVTTASSAQASLEEGHAATESSSLEGASRFRATRATPPTLATHEEGHTRRAAGEQTHSTSSFDATPLPVIVDGMRERLPEAVGRVGTAAENSQQSAPSKQSPNRTSSEVTVNLIGTEKAKTVLPVDS
jgi:hypothetical protein